MYNRYPVVFNPLTPTVAVGTAIKHPVPDRVKPSFVIFDLRGTLTLTTERQRGTLKMRDWNMQDRNMRHQIAGVEYAGLENTAPTWNEKSREHR